MTEHRSTQCLLLSNGRAAFNIELCHLVVGALSILVWVLRTGVLCVCVCVCVTLSLSLFSLSLSLFSLSHVLWQKIESKDFSGFARLKTTLGRSAACSTIYRWLLFPTGSWCPCSLLYNSGSVLKGTGKFCNSYNSNSKISTLSTIQEKPCRFWSQTALFNWKPNRNEGPVAPKIKNDTLVGISFFMFPHLVVRSGLTSIAHLTLHCVCRTRRDLSAGIRRRDELFDTCPVGAAVLTYKQARTQDFGQKPQVGILDFNHGGIQLNSEQKSGPRIPSPVYPWEKYPSVAFWLKLKWPLRVKRLSGSLALGFGTQKRILTKTTFALNLQVGLGQATLSFRKGFVVSSSWREREVRFMWSLLRRREQAAFL